MDALCALLESDPDKRRHWLADRILEQDPGGGELPEAEEEFVRLIIAIGGGRDGY